MAFITGKHLPRRTFLRGAGASVALPFLDAMVPAGRAWAGTTPEQKVPSSFTRLVCIEESMGVAGSSDWGDPSISSPRPASVATSNSPRTAS